MAPKTRCGIDLDRLCVVERQPIAIVGDGGQRSRVCLLELLDRVHLPAFGQVAGVGRVQRHLTVTLARVDRLQILHGLVGRKAAYSAENRHAFRFKSATECDWKSATGSGSMKASDSGSGKASAA